MTQRIEEKRSQELAEGNVANFTERQSVLDSNTVSYLIQNPTSNTETAKITNISVAAEGSFTVDIHTNVVEDVAGNPLATFTNRVGQSSVPNSVVVETKGDYSDLNTDPYEGLVPGGHEPEEVQAGEIILPPGNNILVQFKNVSGSEQKIAPRIEVIE